MLLDIGAGNTEIGVFSGNGFVYTNTIPMGGNSITNDIAIVLNISEDEAEKLKKQYGLAMKSYIENDSEIILNTCKDEGQRAKVIKTSLLVEIMEARIDEIFSMINKDISNQGIKPYINNVILTGQGIININKSDVAGKVILNIPIKVSTGRLVSMVKPDYRTAYSLVRYIAGKPYLKTVSSSIDSNTKENIFKTIFYKIKEFFYS
jgi:cell division protein FtsA